VDAGAAVAARGFPAAVSVAVPLEVTDNVLPANSGRWTLEVNGGQGKLAAGSGAGGTPLRLGARGLAALYGGVPVSTLRRAGLAAGGTPTGDDALDSALGGRPAFMLHGF
jgi:predicted acetyltransferase